MNIYSCAICLVDNPLYYVSIWCETPCCFQKFHRECINTWIDTHKKCPMCREKIRSKVLLFSIRERTDEEYKEDIGIRKNRSKVLENIRERNEDTVYIDEIEDDDNDGIPDRMPDLIGPDDPGYYDLPMWDETSPHYIGASAVQYLGLQLPAANADYDGDYDDAVDNDGMPELVPYYNGWNETHNHHIGASASASASAVQYLGLQLPAGNAANAANADYDGAIVLPQNIQNSGQIIENDDIDYNSLYPSEMISSAFAPEFTFEGPIHLSRRLPEDILMLKRLQQNIIDTFVSRYTNVSRTHVIDDIGYNPLQLPYFTSSENGDINVVNINTMEEVD